MGRTFKRGIEFPHEGFVQLAIERYFTSHGYEVDISGRVDLVCRHPTTGQVWHIEAKGVTTQVGLDFRTGLGQLVQAISVDTTLYGLAVPDTPAFQAQIARVSARVTRLLNLHWLVVAPDGAVGVFGPRREKCDDH